MGIALAAVAVFSLRGVGEILIFDRVALLNGQAWRLWTGHVVHHNSAHLFWNLVALLVVGGWLERIAPRLARLFMLAAAPVIAGALLAFDEDLKMYGGLSGVVVGLVVLLALRRLSTPGESRRLWQAVLALVAFKIALEWKTGAALIAGEIRSVPLAHVAGCVCAVACHFGARLLERRRVCGIAEAPRDGGADQARS